MKCVRGSLFTVDGMMDDETEVNQQILDAVRCCRLRSTASMWLTRLILWMTTFHQRRLTATIG